MNSSQPFAASARLAWRETLIPYVRLIAHPFLGLVLGVILVVALFPIVTNSPTLREEIFLVLMAVILASSVNIIMGYTGYVSFGNIVFFGLGGYVAFFMMLTFHVHLAVAVLAGGIFAALFATLLGIPVLRLRGAYFALATIGINEAVRAFVNNFDPFGGSVGMNFDYSFYDAYGGAKNALWLAYYAIVLVALATVAASFIIKQSKFGLGLMGIREDQDAAQVLGIQPARYKVIAYAISALFPAMAGAVFFFKNGIIEPGPAFSLTASIEGLVAVMLGGFGTVAGPIVGAVVYDRLRSFLLTSGAFSELHVAVAGVLLLLIVLFVPAGLVGELRRRVPWLRKYTE
ncbi:MAG: branched-chain amino acid ABC transporter permease [Chloroflexi bacterium]|nr:branched-chain amino acid ABC transporter permease [Chloroflexota bacterium]